MPPVTLARPRERPTKARPPFRGTRVSAKSGGRERLYTPRVSSCINSC